MAQDFQLTIRLVDGNLTLGGNVNPVDKVLWYGLLELARDAIQAYKAPVPQLVTPRFEMPPHVGNGGKG